MTYMKTWNYFLSFSDFKALVKVLRDKTPRDYFYSERSGSYFFCSTVADEPRTTLPVSLCAIPQHLD